MLIIVMHAPDEGGDAAHAPPPLACNCELRVVHCARYTLYNWQQQAVLMGVAAFSVFFPRARIDHCKIVQALPN